jgi:hypothetical protein
MEHESTHCVPRLSYGFSSAQSSQDEILQLSLRAPNRDAEVSTTETRIEKNDRKR